MRVVVVDQDSPSLREQLRKTGFDYLVRRPVHPEALRLLLLHCVYTGEERRGQPRVPVGFEISFRSWIRRRRALLTDLSVGGCRLLTPRSLARGKSIKLTLPEELGATAPVTLRGRIARCDFDERLGDEGLYRSAIRFENVERETRKELEWIVETQARGPLTLPRPRGVAETAEEPPKKTTTRERVRIRRDNPRVEPTTDVATAPEVERRADRRPRSPLEGERRCWSPRSGGAGRLERPLRSPPKPPRRLRARRSPPSATPRCGCWSAATCRQAECGSSARSWRSATACTWPSTERPGDEPMLVWGTATRKDEQGRITLLFDELEPDITHALEKLVARLPAVEPLRDGESAAMGTVISKIVEP